jgi:hypothetical protein
MQIAGNPCWRTFCLPNAPFYVGLRQSPYTPTLARLCVTWHRCEGRTPFDAVVLESHRPNRDQDWPAASSEMWFSVHLGTHGAGSDYLAEVAARVSGVTKMRIVLLALDLNLRPICPVGMGAPEGALFSPLVALHGTTKREIVSR